MSGGEVGNVIREYLKRDPHGYYIILVSKDELSKIPNEVKRGLIIEELSVSEYVIRTRSRDIVMKVLKLLSN